jgi:osmotically-inducible protein OsmY
MKTDQLQEDVLAEIDFDPRIESKTIVVVVTNGIVTLSGEVPNFYEKWNTERAVKRVAGVAGIAEEITVQPFPHTEQTDTEIATAARAAILWNMAIPNEQIQIMVEQGMITLEGQVDWQFQKQNVYDAVIHLRGVQGVYNRIALKPFLTSADVRQTIEAAFKRSADLDAKQVHVTVENGNVTLKGNLPTWSERDAASRVAWNAAGVMTVKNQITVSN